MLLPQSSRLSGIRFGKFLVHVAYVSDKVKIVTKIEIGIMVFHLPEISTRLRVIILTWCNKNDKYVFLWFFSYLK